MRTDESRLTWALILSVLLHGLILTLLPLARQARLALPQPPRMIDVDLAAIPKVVVPKAARLPAPQAAPAPGQAVPPPAIPVPKQQIVSPPDKGEEKEPANTRFLSDRNNVVKQEMVHRGEPAAGSPEGKGTATKKEQAEAAKPRVAETKAEAKRQRADSGRKPAAGSGRSATQFAALPKLDQLLPPTGELVREGALRQEEEPAAAPAPQQQAKVERNDLLRHGDPWRTNGLGGTRDFLPAVRDGDVTMLNTKADQFAPFVRRVAVRVFQNFVMLVRRSRDSGRDSTEEFATVEAVMDRTGRVLSIETKRRSGSVAFATDRKLQTACRQGFFDRNPPSGAEATDGNIHFLFDARITVVQDGAGHRVPAWVMMGAGLL